ncbi:LIM and SH3 domain protein Lasp [Amphibalanus amphitrite]|uniref:LIM and SH3 domain protein Lasp n=1 Tax=Amphibalanus amphitrite TaxID=1232801 RepID=A0A6A4VX01_AMPAM|nr:LIM and SH3 domain protein Lasp [Amphibalanus amphitrite]
MNKKCGKCTKTVYPTEELKCLDKSWHKGCFRCWECGMALNMRTYKGFNKLPYCEAHIPKPKATTVAETPELARIAENTKIQSNVKYHAEFEAAKGKFTTVADDPETLRIKQNTKIISNAAYHGELEKKADMDQRRHLTGQNGDAGRYRFSHNSRLARKLNTLNAYLTRGQDEILAMAERAKRKREAARAEREVELEPGAEPGTESGPGQGRRGDGGRRRRLKARREDGLKRWTLGVAKRSLVGELTESVASRLETMSLDDWKASRCNAARVRETWQRIQAQERRRRPTARPRRRLTIQDCTEETAEPDRVSYRRHVIQDLDGVTQRQVMLREARRAGGAALDRRQLSSLLTYGEAGATVSESISVTDTRLERQDGRRHQLERVELSKYGIGAHLLEEEEEEEQEELDTEDEAEELAEDGPEEQLRPVFDYPQLAGPHPCGACLDEILSATAGCPDGQQLLPLLLGVFGSRRNHVIFSFDDDDLVGRGGGGIDRTRLRGGIEGREGLVHWLDSARSALALARSRFPPSPSACLPRVRALARRPPPQS